MAGYQYQPKKYVLKFEDYEGLEVVCRGISVGELVEFGELGDKLTGTPDVKDLGALFGHFIRHLIGWNLEQDGKPVPKSVDALIAMDLDFSMAIVDAWMSAVTPGKSATSNGTKDQMEASIPMSPTGSANGT